MKYRAIPQNFTEGMALLFGLLPMPMVDTLFPLVKARALMAANRLGIFPALAAGPLSSAQLASQLGLHADSLDVLLRVVVAAGYLEMRGGALSLSGHARRTLLAGSPMDSRGFVEFNDFQWQLMEHLEAAVRTGEAVDLHATLQDPAQWRVYQRAMLDIARHHAPILARRVPVRPGAQRLLDVAGSHGLLGAAVCRRHPPLRAVVLDLPAAIPHARALAQEAGIDDVVEHAAGDVVHDDFEAGQDVILLANILHHLSPEQNRDVLRRAHTALNAGGTVAIWEIERRGDGARPELLTDVSSLIFRMSSASRCFAADDYCAWLADAGFDAIRTVRAAAAPIHVLIHAAKRA
jgi:2-polyprenyl-3-methyl-5-hydroxy-6-metoxy-1,4-benzoquinol methylase